MDTSRPSFIRSRSDNSSTTRIASSSKDLNNNHTNSGTAGPQRPPRNPARSRGSSEFEQEKVVVIRPKTVTGTKEEVTPWELHPAPASPEPTPPKRISRPISSGGHSHGPGISLSDLSLLRRRKSTGSKAKPPLPSHQVLQKQRGTLGPSSPHNSSTKVSTNENNHNPRALKIATDPSLSRQHQQSSSQSHTTTSPSAVAHTSQQPVTSPALPIQKSLSTPNPDQHLKFSTADRTILEELKKNISARESQFVVKGPTLDNGRKSSGGYRGGYGGSLGLGIEASVGGLGVAEGGRKHHPYDKEEVPYPRSYDREVLDLDIWETMFNQRICESLTWHVFKEPPTKVLDIGCGTGMWTLEAARLWRKCHFVGLDIVPVQPDLQQVSSADFAQRVTWVQGNFLEGLPFPNEEFDFVHIKRISLGVPEDKWDSLFEEITRVMKPGAAFEMIEEDLLFPGGIVRNEDEDEIAAEDLSWADYDDPAYFSDSGARHYTGASLSSSYFATSPRNRNQSRSHTSPSTTSTARSKLEERRVSSRTSREAHGRRRSKKLDYAALTSLMGLSDVENDIAESEREDEGLRDYGGSDRDSYPSSGSRGNSFTGDEERVSEELLSTSSMTTPGTSPNLNSPTLPSASSSASSSALLASPLTVPVASKLPIISTTKGTVDAIVEDEEGEKSATLDFPSVEQHPGISGTQAASVEHLHSKDATDSTVTPVTITKSPSSSSLTPHPPSASLTDLRSSLSSSNTAVSPLTGKPALPPKRPLSASGFGMGTSGVHLPSMSFSQSMLSLSSDNTVSPVPGTTNDGRPKTTEGKISNNVPPAPFVLRSLPKPPVNPRDHSMLEMIYNEMNAARFVNLSPLSMLPNVLSLHFKDLRTHPPVIFAFPPHAAIEKPLPDSTQEEFDDPDEEAQDAIRPSPSGSDIASRRASGVDSSPVSRSPVSPRPSYFQDGTDNEYDHWLSMQQIIKRESPYIIYDGSRLSAYPPSAKASFFSLEPDIEPKSLPLQEKQEKTNTATNIDSGRDTPRAPQNASDPNSAIQRGIAQRLRFRLPNTTMNIDLRSLNLHLALRVTEIVACSETMWEWVLDHQERSRNQMRIQKTAGRARSRSIDLSHKQIRNYRQLASENAAKELKAAIAELTREEYDQLLRRFCLDMQDCMALPSAIEERFGWKAFPTGPSEERKTFEKECERFHQWEAEQQEKITLRSHSGGTSRQRPLSVSFPSPISVLNSSQNNFSGLPTSPVETKLLLSEEKRHVRRDSFSSNSILSQQSSSTVAPSRRLSRSLRIFVAWKGTEPTSS